MSNRRSPGAASRVESDTPSTPITGARHVPPPCMRSVCRCYTNRLHVCGNWRAHLFHVEEMPHLMSCRCDMDGGASKTASSVSVFLSKCGCQDHVERRACSAPAPRGAEGFRSGAIVPLVSGHETICRACADRCDQVGTRRLEARPSDRRHRDANLKRVSWSSGTGLSINARLTNAR